MSEFEDMLGKILSDPAEMGKIAELASQLMGGDGGGEKGGGEADAASLAGMLGAFGGKSDKAALVAALGPFLKPERRRRLEKALRIGRLAGIAEIAMSGLGEGDV